MAKKKVMLFFGILLLLVLILSIASFSNSESITGKTIYSYSEGQELFIGSNYQFYFDVKNVEVKNNIVNVKGELTELEGMQQDLEITAYALSKEGEIIGEHIDNAFIAQNDKILVSFNFPYQLGKQVNQVIVYFNNQETMTKGTYLVSRNLIDGNVVLSLSSGENVRAFIWIVFLSIISLIVLGVRNSYKKHKKEMHFSEAIQKKHHKKFIDLDIR